MGRLANTIVIDESGPRVFCNYWKGESLPYQALGGPDSIIRSAEAESGRNPGRWLDETEARGGFLIDSRSRTFLFYSIDSDDENNPMGPYGGEFSDLHLRTALLEVARGVWRGWTIEWAHEGQVSFRRHLNMEVRDVLSPDWEDPSGHYPLSFSVDKANPETIYTLYDVGGLKIYPLGYDSAWKHLSYGPGFMKKFRFPREHLRRILSLHRIHNVPFPEYECPIYPAHLGGIHIHRPKREMSFWTAQIVPDIMRRIADRWRGWNVIWWKDEYSRHAEATGNRLRFVRGFSGENRNYFFRSLLETARDELQAGRIRSVNKGLQILESLLSS